MENELLLEIKKTTRTVDKKPKEPVAEHYLEVGGVTYNMKRGGLGGNTGRCMILMSVGEEYPADVVVSQRIKNPSLAKKAKTVFGSLPSIVPGIHEEAAADLIATAKTIEKGSALLLDQLLLDVPSLQRSKQYYLNQIESHFQNCQEHNGSWTWGFQNHIVYCVCKSIFLSHQMFLWYAIWATVRKTLGTGVSKMEPSASKRFSTSTEDTPQLSILTLQQTAATLGSG